MSDESSETSNPAQTVSGESKFDLIALEQTRYGLRLAGLGFAVWAIARPFVDFCSPLSSSVDALIGWTLTMLAMLFLIVAFRILRPPPHGPLARPLAFTFSAICLLELIPCGTHFYWVWTGTITEFAVSYFVLSLDLAARAMCIALPWILWHFCARRGLGSLARAWLTIALLATPVELGDMYFSRSGELWDWVSKAIWGFVPLGFFAYLVAHKTAREVWLDAVERHSKFFVITNPRTDVMPLRPADHH